jgi:putative nucleotidyltransferase with HDIG domain
MNPARITERCAQLLSRLAGPRSSPPRLVVRATIASMAMVAVVLSTVFAGVTLNVRARVRAAVAERLEAGQRMLSELEQRRARELRVQVATFAENPTLKQAVATYKLEIGGPNAVFRRGMVAAIRRELDKVASRTSTDVLAVTDVAGNVLAVAGRRDADWPVEAPVQSNHTESGTEYVSMRSGVFQFASAPLALQNTTVGTLQLAKALDRHYAEELSRLSGAPTLIASGEKMVATTLPPELAPALTPEALRSFPSNEIVNLGGSEYAVKLLFSDGDARVYALDSIAASTRVPLQNAFRATLIIAICSFGLATVASIWLARTISRPIDTLSKSLSKMTKTRDFEHLVPPSGSSLEVDTLTAAFNSMMQSVSTAEAERQSAYLGSIRALAMALDARDPYTAGHSERVSVISVAVGRQMKLPEDELETLRLGALLHDIGKIGITDAVLRKPGPLTPDEFELIREHPSVGARILRSVPFLSAQLPIVELHHERPDGKGYPHRLSGDEIPLAARIVHVVDAFDAITSARAYRPARSTSEALRELWRYAGAQFDVDVVRALTAAVPAGGHEVLVPAALSVPKLAMVHGRRRATAGRA